MDWEYPGQGTTEDWTQMARVAPRHYLSLIKRTADKVREALSEQGRAKVCEGATGTTVDQMSAGSERFLCYECGDTFHSTRQLRAHRGKWHQTPLSPNSFVTGSVCPICLKDYHQGGRLLKHVHQVASCRLAWIRSGMRPSPEELAEDKALRRDQQRANRARGVVCRTTTRSSRPWLSRAPNSTRRRWRAHAFARGPSGAVSMASS